MDWEESWERKPSCRFSRDPSGSIEASGDIVCCCGLGQARHPWPTSSPVVIRQGCWQWCLPPHLKLIQEMHMQEPLKKKPHLKLINHRRTKIKVNTRNAHAWIRVIGLFNGSTNICHLAVFSLYFLWPLSATERAFFPNYAHFLQTVYLLCHLFFSLDSSI